MQKLDTVENLQNVLDVHQRDAGVPRLDGHQVCKVLWQGRDFTIFEDQNGTTWRYSKKCLTSWLVTLGVVHR